MIVFTANNAPHLLRGRVNSNVLFHFDGEQGVGCLSFFVSCESVAMIYIQGIECVTFFCEAATNVRIPFVQFGMQPLKRKTEEQTFPEVLVRGADPRSHKSRRV